MATAYSPVASGHLLQQVFTIGKTQRAFVSFLVHPECHCLREIGDLTPLIHTSNRHSAMMCLSLSVAYISDTKQPTPNTPSVATVVTTTSIILGCDKIQNGEILVLDYLSDQMSLLYPVIEICL